MPLMKRRPPTHVLHLEIPLFFNEDEEAFNYHPMHEALNVVMSVSRLAVDRVLCGDIQVSIETKIEERA